MQLVEFFFFCQNMKTKIIWNFCPNDTKQHDVCNTAQTTVLQLKRLLRKLWSALIKMQKKSVSVIPHKMPQHDKHKNFSP